MSRMLKRAGGAGTALAPSALMQGDVVALSQLRVKLFADGADLSSVAALARDLPIKGFTTNPTLMRKAQVRDYRQFALEFLALAQDRPVSFEVFSDDFAEMEQQAHEIASWGPQVYVKIPVMNAQGEFSESLIRRLSAAGVKMNVTAVFTLEQVQRVAECVSDETSSVISVFAGRIADTGRDPVPLMAEAVRILKPNPNAELLWASPRELLNIFHADAVGCHIITVTSDVLAKLPLIGKDLSVFSLETVQMFRRDALQAGLSIDLPQTVAASARPLAQGARR